MKKLYKNKEEFMKSVRSFKDFEVLTIRGVFTGCEYTEPTFKEFKRHYEESDGFSPRTIEELHTMWYDFCSEKEEKWQEMHWTEIEQMLKYYGINNTWSTPVFVHFIDSPFGNSCMNWTTINDAIERLAIKDGADLVRFSNGNIGFVSYYNCSYDAFEILTINN